MLDSPLLVFSVEALRADEGEGREAEDAETRAGEERLNDRRNEEEEEEM